MAHQTSHKCILAAPNPRQTAMDPTAKRHPKPSPFSAAGGGVPDPTTTAPPTTIQAISHHFSKLCTHHKKLLPNSLKPHPTSRFLTHPQSKNPSLPPIQDSSCSTLSKSSSQRERNISVISGLAKSKVKEKADHNIKKPTSKKVPRRSSFEEYDVKKASQLMSKSLDCEAVGIKKGGFQEGGLEVRGRISLSLSSVPPPVNGGVRRRSFCSSQVELGDFLSCSGVKVVAVDMPPFMQIHAVDCARKAHDSLEKFTSKSLAFTLKKEFDGVYGPAWHCIVGTSFGSFVTHSVGGFIYFSMDHKLYILLFKTTVQRAE